MDAEDIVISGVGGRFPKSANLEQFKERLFSNEILLGSRWKEGEHGVSNKIGVFDNVDKFDTSFFGIHRNQATYMDPMQRMLLERAFEALADAGVNPHVLRGKKVGVFTATGVGENDNIFYESVVSGFGVTGHSKAMMANRISYWLDLKGPSCAFDSNWIGGIEVLSIAANAIRHGRCDSALIGTVNLVLNSRLSWLYKDMGLISDDGSTRAFDIDACGYARADGVIIMFLQKACDANRAYASIVHAATVYDGVRDTPILAIDENGMTEFLDKFYKDCKVDPGQVEYVEAFGCGIKERDEIELKSIESVYCKKREKPLLIGALKPQTGHAEASDNLLAIAKMLIAFEAEQIPATLQYKTPNPNIPGLFNGNLEVVTANRPWKGELAAVHGIGITSSYAHVLFRKNSKRKQIADDNIPNLMIASTRTEAGIQQILKTLQTDPNIDRDYIALTHKFFSKAIPAHLYRGYTILDKTEPPKHEFDHYQGNKRPIWFIYSGMGSQWVGMGTELLKLPIFAESIMKCHKTLLPKGIDLLHIITTDDPKIFDSILHAFVGIAAVQIALTDVLRALGVVPDGILGHSVGELGCAYADECLTAEQMILCSYSRGRASLETELIKGMMAAIGMGYHQVKDKLPSAIEVACHNSKDNCTLSGPTEDMQVYVKELQDKGVFAKLVNVSNIAYHSRYIRPAAPKLLEYLRQIITDPKPRSSKWISTSAPEDKWDTQEAKLCSAEYHTNNLLGSVLFEEGAKHIPDDAIAIEIAPHGLLQAILKRSLKSGCTNIPVTQRANKNGLHFLLSAIGRMFNAGIDVNLAAIYPPIEFPVGRGTASLAPLVHWEHSEKWRIGIENKLNYLISVKDIHIMLSNEDYRYCTGHEIGNNCVFPLSAYLNIILEIASYGLKTPPSDVVFENIQVKNALVIPKMGFISIHAMVQKGSGSFEVLCGKTLLVTGKVLLPDMKENYRANVIDIEMGETTELSSKDVYAEFNHRGHKYSAEFKSIKSLIMGKEGQLSTVSCSNKWQMLLESLLQQHLFKAGEKYQNILMPSYVLKIVVNLNKIPTENQDVEVAYNYYTKIISCESMQVIGIQNKQAVDSRKAINLHETGFVPFSRYSSENIEIVLNNSIHVTLNNFEIPDTKNIIIMEIETKNPLLSDDIRTVLDKNIDINGNFYQTEENKVAIISGKTPILIVCNDTPSENLLNIISSTNVFALVRSSKNILSSESVVQVADFQVQDVNYSLIKKTSNVKYSAIYIKSDVVSGKDLHRDNVPWVRELRSNISGDRIVLLVSPVVPMEGVTNFVSTLRSTLEFRNVRSIFALDKKISLSENPYLMKSIAQRDLYVSVLKNGSYGSYLPIPLDFLHNIPKQLPTAGTLISNKNFKYIGINVNDETLTNEKHEVGLGNIDYVGTDNNNETIFGLAKMDCDSCELVPDSILHWKLPETWAIEEGCSVPHAYTTAYHTLVVRGRVEVGDTVLIHNGCSAIGIALISVAMSFGCTIFTTVASFEQRLWIRKTFNGIVDRNILSNQNSSFELQLLFATGGQGAHVIVNTLSKSLLSSGLRCLAMKGRFVQLGKFDLKEHYSIGMSVFLANTSFAVVVPENIFDLPVEDKVRLRELVQRGLDNYHVTPLPHRVSNEASVKPIIERLIHKDNIGKILIKVTSDIGVNYLFPEKPNQFLCDSKSSYLIYGGSSDMWTDLVEWLVFRGARRVVVSSDNKAQTAYLNRRLDLLRRLYNAQIHYIANAIQTKENASEFLSEVYKIGPINSVFILPIKLHQTKQSDIKPIQYLDMALRNISPKTLFVNLFSGSFGLSQSRFDAEFPTYNVEWPDTVEFADVLFGLDKILGLKTQHVAVKSAKMADILQETTEALYKKLTLILPASSEDLLEQYESASPKAKFRQVLTLGPKRIREVPPVFVIPGLSNANVISESCFPLLHPTFVAQLPNVPVPLEVTAKEIAEEIVTIYPRGPYNLVGISWGGALLIEIGKILQKRASTQLTFVDSAPDSISTTISHLGEPANIEVTVLLNLLNITSTEILRSMTDAPNFDARLEIALSQYKGDKEREKDLKDALNLLMYRIHYLTSYKPSDDLFTGQVFLIRPTGCNKYDECGLSKYVKQKVTIDIVDGNHSTMLQNDKFTAIINDNIMIRNR